MPKSVPTTQELEELGLEPSGGNWTYGYDEIDRLLTSSNRADPSSNRDYSYNSAGSITSSALGSYIYPAQGPGGAAAPAVPATSRIGKSPACSVL